MEASEMMKNTVPWCEMEAAEVMHAANFGGKEGNGRSSQLQSSSVGHVTMAQ